MRRILAALAIGTLTITLAGPAAYAVPAAHTAEPMTPRAHRVGDGWNRDQSFNHRRRCHEGLVTELLGWLI
jgi:hypothetical protein